MNEGQRNKKYVKEMTAYKYKTSTRLILPCSIKTFVIAFDNLTKNIYFHKTEINK